MKFAIVYGQFKSGDAFVGVSAKAAEPNVLELEPVEAEKMDPGCTKSKLDGEGKEVAPWAGHTLKPLDLYLAELKGEEAAAAAKKAALEKPAKKAEKDGGK